MTIVRKSVLVAHADSMMFDLVERIEDYPGFLPWCGGSTVLERTGDLTRARIVIAFRGIRQSFVTANRTARPGLMLMTLEEGPFSALSGSWRFTALSPAASKVELELEYVFSNLALEKLVGPVFDHIAETMVDRFVAHADAIEATHRDAS